MSLCIVCHRIFKNIQNMKITFPSTMESISIKFPENYNIFNGQKGIHVNFIGKYIFEVI